jgi:hypothetical protein
MWAREEALSILSKIQDEDDFTNYSENNTDIPSAIDIGCTTSTPGKDTSITARTMLT